MSYLQQVGGDGKQMDNSADSRSVLQELACGRTVFYQTLGAIIGLSPVDFYSGEDAH